MPHHRDAALDQRLHGADHRRPALELHRLRAGLLEGPPGVADGLLDRHLVGEEREVDDQQRACEPAAHGGAVVDHLVEGGAERGLPPGHHLVHRVPDEDDVHPGRVEEPGMQGVVAGERDDPPALPLHPEQVERGERLGVSSHGRRAPPSRGARSRARRGRDAAG